MPKKKVTDTTRPTKKGITRAELDAKIRRSAKDANDRRIAKSIRDANKRKADRARDMAKP